VTAQQGKASVPRPAQAAPVAQAAPEDGREALVRAAVAGDRAAFGALVAPQVAPLTRLCRRVAGTALADDCVQDTLVLALLRLPRLLEAAHWEPWLRGIAIRVCLRARGRPAPPAPLPAEEAYSGLWLPGPELGPSPDDALRSPDLAQNVRAAFADLPEGQRRAVQLFYLRGLSYEGAAGELGIPPGALKTRLHKARAALAHYYRLSDLPRPRRLDDRTLSVHEAAHAVLGWLEGDRVQRVAITPRSDGALGHVLMEGSEGGLAPTRRLQVLMAGEAGVARALPGRPRRSSGDRQAAADLARSAAGGDERETALWVTGALQAARERLEDTQTWALVERVSAALVAWRRLDGDDFRRLVSP
jgi:RNA polymerase sigma-70 factor (ECF subfamily)